MIPRKVTKKSIISVLILSLIWGGSLYVLQKTDSQSEYFSHKSLNQLEKLNEEYEMVVTRDLLSQNQPSNLMADIMSAGIPDSEENEHRGLIMTLEDSQDGILLLQPVNEVEEVELTDMAKKYEKAIPEANFEVDQEVTMSSEGIFAPVETLPTEEEQVRLAVIDSGVQMDHPVFEGVEFEVVEGANVRGGNNDLTDEVGHGTHVTSIIAGNTARAVILPFKIVDSTGGKLSDVIKATDLALESDVDMINMSFGVLGGSYGLNQMMDKAAERGVIVVAAAGNFNTDEGFYPATYETTIAVAGVYNNGVKTSKSNYGDWIDTAAHGYKIQSAVPNNDYDTMTGTSQAAAFVSAATCELLAEGEMSQEEILNYFDENFELLYTDPLAGVPLID